MYHLVNFVSVRGPPRPPRAKGPCVRNGFSFKLSQLDKNCFLVTHTKKIEKLPNFSYKLFQFIHWNFWLTFFSQLQKCAFEWRMWKKSKNVQSGSRTTRHTTCVPGPHRLRSAGIEPMYLEPRLNIGEACIRSDYFSVYAHFPVNLSCWLTQRDSHVDGWK